MQIVFSLFCEAAKVTSEGLFSVLDGGIDGIIVPRFPITVPHLFLITRVEFEPNEVGQSHEITVRTSGPNGGQFAGPMQLKMDAKSTEYRTDGKTNYTARFDLSRTTIFEPGDHTFRYFVGETAIGQATLNFALRKSESVGG